MTAPDRDAVDLAYRALAWANVEPGTFRPGAVKGILADAAPNLARAVIAVDNVLQGWPTTAAATEARGWDMSTVEEIAEDIRAALDGDPR